ATAQGRHTVSWRGWDCEIQAGDAASHGPKGAESEHQPGFFGVRFALLIANWDNYRFPVAFRLIRPKAHPEYHTENALFREMVRHFTPPVWATRVIVEGDAAYGSKENMKMVLKRDADDSARRWGFVFAIARTWKTSEGKAQRPSRARAS